MKRTHTTRLSTIAAMVVAVLVLVQRSAQADLSDENFDPPFVVNSPLPGFLPIDTTLLDKWAGEDVTLVSGINDGVSPVTPPNMVKFLDTGASGAWNEIKQRIDVALEVPFIDAGQAVALYFACFNVPQGAGGAEAQIYIRYLDNLGSLIALSQIASTNDIGGLDDDPDTWQHLQIDADPVPVGTRYVEAFIQFDKASLGGYAGYLDKTHLAIRGVPEPAAVGLALVGCGLAIGRRRLRR